VCYNLRGPGRAKLDKDLGDPRINGFRGSAGHLQGGAKPKKAHPDSYLFEGDFRKQAIEIAGLSGPPQFGTGPENPGMTG
jgi:hypothetical protein